MSKGTGLGAAFFHNGYDVTTDIKSVDKIAMPSALLDRTSIDKSAMARGYGLRDGEISVSAYFDDAAGYSHPVFSALPKTDVHQMYCHRSTAGQPAAAHIGLQINYDPVRSADGDLISQVQVLSNGFPVEWGTLLTGGKDNSVGAEDTTGVDLGTTAAAVAITSSSVANPSVITATAHGLATNDRVVIAGHTGSTPDINNAYTVTVTGDNTFTIPVNVTVGGTGGTVTKTSHSYGFAAYLVVFAFTGTDVTLKLQGSSDDAATDAYADVTGGGFTQITTAPVVERIESSTFTQLMERYARINIATATSFSSLDYAVMIVRYTGPNRET